MSFVQLTSLNFINGYRNFIETDRIYQSALKVCECSADGANWSAAHVYTCLGTAQYLVEKVDC